VAGRRNIRELPGIREYTYDPKDANGEHLGIQSLVEYFNPRGGKLS